MAVANRKRAVNRIPAPAAKTAAKRGAAGRANAQSMNEPLAPPPVTATMSSKGQVVIPAELRRKYRLEEGVTVLFREKDGHIVLEPDRFAALLSFRGTLPAEAETELMEERRKEREREDRER